MWIPPVSAGVALIAWWRHGARWLVAATLTLGFWACGVVLGDDAYDHAIHTSLRSRLDQEFHAFTIESLGPEGDHDPLRVQLVLTEDASRREGFMSLRANVIALQIGEHWHAVDGGVIVTVSGAVTTSRAQTWRAGRTIVAPMTFRRPAQYLNEGVGDFERDLALDGITLLATVKSGLLIEVVARGSALEETAADIRGHVRQAIATWIAPYDPVSGAIATAVLIGDRTGLPDDTRNALQAAGTYHVIAISGGNIAIVATAIMAVLAIVGIRGRPACLVAIVVLAAYALIVTAGPSVWRATLMAMLYFAARALDQRVPVWHAAAVAAAVMVVAQPLDVRDPGFILTFGATGALLEGARRGASLVPRFRICSWALASAMASMSVEIVLVPVSASAFSRVTSAGVLLNLLAVPSMGVLQIAASIVALADAVPFFAARAGWTAHAAATVLVKSAGLVTAAPWLTARVPPPGAAIVIAYYLMLTAACVFRGRARFVCGVAFLFLLIVIGSGVDITHVVHRHGHSPTLRLTMFDVGQGESMLLETPRRRAILIDTGGAPFGASLDIGRRVLAPALWARHVTSLDALLLTHADPDHVGGAIAILEDFSPGRIWDGVRVPNHAPTETLIQRASGDGMSIDTLRSGQSFSIDDLTLRVLHPPEPDWERRRVRNDDSVVIEIVYRDVALLLTGDIGSEIERSIASRLTPARTRILKVAHHGSRTSSSQILIDAWHPQFALISCGRGNRFGHPAPEVLRRLEASGATVFRTDREGEITLETDGYSLRATTFVDKNRE